MVVYDSFFVQAEDTFSNHAINSGAEWNYSAGVPLSTAQSILHLIHAKTAFSGTAATMGIVLGWNYLDGLIAIAAGIQQLADKNDYRQTQNKVQGMLNLLSGVQLFALSYNPAATAALGLSSGIALAAPSFAFAMMCDLINASIDLVNAEREAKFKTMLDERYKEKKYNKQRLDDFKQEQILLEGLIAKAQLLPEYDAMYLEELKESLHAVKQKIIDLNIIITTINQDIEGHSKCYLKFGELGYIPAGEQPEDRLQVVNQVRQKHGERVIHHEELTQPHMEPTVSQHSRYNDWKTGAIKERDQSRITFTLKAASFIGMTLLAVAPFVSCPPVLIAGIAITAVVALAYLARNTNKIGSLLGKNSSTLFAKQPANNGPTPYIHAPENLLSGEPHLMPSASF